jgi:hypothetical protein
MNVKVNLFREIVLLILRISCLIEIERSNPSLDLDGLLFARLQSMKSYHYTHVLYAVGTYEPAHILFDCAHCGGGVRTVALALWIGCPQTQDLKKATS